MIAVGTLSAWLLSIAVPVVKKVLVALGIGSVTYAGLSLVGGSIQANIVSYWGAVGGATLQIASLGGIPEAIGIILGACNARLAMMAYGRLGKVAAS